MTNLPESMADFYEKYGAEVQALRIEMGDCVSRRMERDGRDSNVPFAVAMLAMQELMSSILATMFRTPEARQKIYPEVMKMLISDTENLSKMRDAE